MVPKTMWKAFLDALPRGYSLEEKDWQRRHRLLMLLLVAHVPALALTGVLFGHDLPTIAIATVPQLGCVALGRALRHRRRLASVLVTGGFVYSSTALVGLTGGAIESHFHFFIIIGFIALYQDWAPFLFMILFTTLSHAGGSLWQQNLIFSHTAGQGNPWLWSLIHGVAVLFACVGMMLFWRLTEESQLEKDALARKLAQAEIGRRQFTSDLLVNLARRNQSMIYRQLDIINQLEENESDPDALADLFTLDHLATRVRRNAESLLVLSGEQPARTWGEPVPLRDVLRAAIAETEDLDRVVTAVDERPAVAGNTVTDLTHLIAELTENAVRFSPPDTTVTIRARPDRRDAGGYLVTVEDWGVGMPAADLATANALLAAPADVDLSVSQRLGFHVVARLASRHGIHVSLGATPGSGITAVVVLPSTLFEPVAVPAGRPLHAGGPAAAARGTSNRTPPPPAQLPLQPAPAGRGSTTATLTREPEDRAPARWDDGGPPPFGGGGSWEGWWDPTSRTGHTGPVPTVSGPGASGTGAAGPGWSGTAPDPAHRQRPTPTPRPSSGSGSHSGKGSRRGPVAAPPSPARSVPGETPGTTPAAGIALRRRVPQAHLAPELRQPVAPAPVSAFDNADDAAGAASRLSRYQASRAAARATSSDGSS